MKFLDGLNLRCFNIEWDNEDYEEEFKVCKSEVIVNYITNELAEIICPKCKFVKYMALNKEKEIR